MKAGRAEAALDPSDEVFPSTKSSDRFCAELPRWELPNLRSFEPVARMLSAGITNFRQG
jgi:hypothetical protein